MSECIEHGGCRLPFGHGQVRVNGLTRLAHRVAWETKNGAIPVGLCVLHTCDNAACINTDHLFIGTQADNIADMDSKGRRAIRAAHGRARLSENQVAAIRADDARTQRAIAADYGIDQSTVSLIKTRKTWR